MTDKNNFERYLLALRKTPIDEKTEHTDRGALQTLLQGLVNESAPGVAVQHEPKRITNKGAPDFKVTKAGLILGYVENKAIGENLNKVLKSDQLKKYQGLSDNIIVTDYLQWIWINKYGPPQTEILCHATDLENPKFKLRDDRVDAVCKLLQGFFSTAPEGIGRAQQLALALATRSQLLRDYIGEELVRQEHEHKQGRLYGLFQVFRDQVFHELTLKEFADAFAQMLAYGLFLARLNSNLEPVTLHNAREYVPGSFRLIRELIDFLTELDKKEYRDVRWVVEEVLSIVNALDLPAIHEDLSFRRRKAISRKVRASDEEEHRLFERDPFIYFYEDYLKAYDSAMRKSRGVYYTPPPIVNFIVRAVDEILKEGFEIRDGLADHQRVTVLDFACGTGTFLLEVFQQVFDNIGGPGAGNASRVVREHLLKNIFGFEYLIAPYTIAHLKLSQYLRDQGHPLKSDERLQVFLTNTLEPIHPEPNFLLPAITAETEAAQTVKDQPILVITGNPPYSGHSKNKGVSITAAIDGYKEVDGKPLGEKNPKWLQDDYVKFIRFAQMKMDSIEQGVVGIITNHSYLDNPTFRGMRQSLLQTFDQIWILDLHGSTKPKELAPAGVDNENVFDIQKGVAIALFVKKPGASRGVWYSEFWGSRLDKYRSAASASFSEVGWQEVRCISPYYMFRPLDWTGWESYQLGWSIADSLNPANEKAQIFDLNVLGFQSHRDHFAIAFERSEIEDRARRMIDTVMSDQELASEHQLKNNRDWNIADARKALRAKKDWQKSVLRCAYRPFDNPYCFFGQEFMDYPRRELLDNVAGRDNIELVASRQIGTATWRHAFVANGPANDCLISDQSREANQVFPLWRFNDQNVRRENFSAKFRSFLDARYEHPYTPEEIFSYVYAVLYAPTYRARHSEFLRFDFPRVPFPESSDHFETLSELGWALVQAHLSRELPRQGLGIYHGKGDDAVEAVRYSLDEEAIWINKTQFFKPVPPAIWEFHIGGYQVLDKYLKSRKDRALSLEEINHVRTIVDSLAFTIGQMARIDEAYQAAFPERG